MTSERDKRSLNMQRLWSGRLIQAVSASDGGVGGLRTNRSGCLV